MIKSGGTSALFYVFAQLTMQQFTEKEVRESYGQALRMEPQCSSTIWYKRSFSLMIVYNKLKYDHFQRQFFPLTSANAVLQSLHESRKIRRFSRFLHKKDPADDRGSRALFHDEQFRRFSGQSRTRVRLFQKQRQRYGTGHSLPGGR